MSYILKASYSLKFILIPFKKNSTHFVLQVISDVFIISCLTRGRRAYPILIHVVYAAFPPVLLFVCVRTHYNKQIFFSSRVFFVFLLESLHLQKYYFGMILYLFLLRLVLLLLSQIRHVHTHG